MRGIKGKCRFITHSLFRYRIKTEILLGDLKTKQKNKTKQNNNNKKKKKKKKQRYAILSISLGTFV